MFNCGSYSGVTCVDGGCPDALAEEYSDYGYTHTDCSECAYYRGCKDCYFNRRSRCVVYEKDIQWVYTIEDFMKVYYQNIVHSVHIFKYTLCIVRIYTMCIVCYHIRVRKIESAQSIRIKG